ncbi:MAG TPA: rhomboid family intramembrane serine protease [Myxococcales bacterium]|jgi:membrane associated rhomboid family serine protease
MAEQTDWTELVVKAAELLGFNPVRLRWKLHRMREEAAKAKVAASDKVTELSYAHKACASCGAVADQAEKKCPRCGAALRSKLADRLYRIGLVLPVAWSFSTLLAFAFGLAYLRMSAVEPGGIVQGFGNETLLRFGALWPPALEAEPWRLGTAMFLHLGLLHLGFNTVALLQIGPTIEDLYGRWALPGFFLATGLLANLASLEMGLSAVQAGASGGLMGLTGVAAGWGHREGTSLGRDVRNRMLQWVAYTVLFGFFVHADNVAHVGGFVCGAVVGFLVRPEAMKRFSRSPAAIPAALVVGLASVALLGLTLVPPPGSPWASARSSPGALLEDADGPEVDVEAELGGACELLSQGQAEQARAALAQSRLLGGAPPEQLGDLCLHLRQLRERCARMRRGEWEGLLPADLEAARREQAKQAWLRTCPPAR